MPCVITQSSYMWCTIANIAYGAFFLQHRYANVQAGRPREKTARLVDISKAPFGRPFVRDRSHQATFTLQCKQGRSRPRMIRLDSLTWVWDYSTEHHCSDGNLLRRPGFEPSSLVWNKRDGGLRQYKIRPNYTNTWLTFNPPGNLIVCFIALASGKNNKYDCSWLLSARF